MRKRLSRRMLGAIAIFAGCATVAVTALTDWGNTASASFGYVFLVISIADSSNGHLRTGSTVTLTANLTNTSDASRDATPTVTLSYSTSVMSFVSNGQGWVCSAGTGAAGVLTCYDGTLSPGGTESLPVVFSVGGNPGEPASVSATVTDANAPASPTFEAVTDRASVENPGSYTNGVPPGSFPEPLGTDQVVTDSGSAATYTFTDGDNRVAVHVPAGALPANTHISAYRANPSFWSASASSSNRSFIDGYAVAWTASGASTGMAAASPLTLTASDSSASSDDTIYRATTSGIGPALGAASNGSWLASFTDDPGFVLVRSSTTTTTHTSTSSTRSGGGATGPDLVISALRASRNRQGKLSLKATTKNVGNRSAGRSRTAFYLRSDTGRHKFHELGSKSVGRLAPGHSSVQKLKVGVPPKLAAGKYGVIACADATRKVKETSETNNCRISTATITVHKHRAVDPAASFSVTPRPPGSVRYVMLSPQSAGAPGRMTPVVLLLLGVMSIVAGTVLVGLRRRTLPAALA